MTREEIKEIKGKALLAMNKGRYHAYTPSPMRLVNLCTLALEALDKRDAERKAEVETGIYTAKPFEPGGTGF